jgi:peptidyl-prolyl cis-trans isomerase B (cyclophilin B)
MHFPRKITAISVVVFLVSSLLANTATAAPRPTTKPAANNNEVKVTCKPTTAVAHREVKMTIPKLQKFKRNKVITFSTNCGDIVIEAFAKKAPITTSMITGLVSAKFYDQSICHRMINSSTAALLQCGDPTDSGYGGPAFQFNDENLPKPIMSNYPAGTVAMANSTQLKDGELINQNTNGSQFFIMAENTTLDPYYTVWGRVTKGLEIVKAVVATGTLEGGEVGRPKVKIAIEKATVR